MNSDYAKKKMWQIGIGKIHRREFCVYIKLWLRGGLREVYHFPEAIPDARRCKGCWR